MVIYADKIIVSFNVEDKVMNNCEVITIRCCPCCKMFRDKKHLRVRINILFITNYVGCV